MIALSKRNFYDTSYKETCDISFYGHNSLIDIVPFL